MVLTYTPIPHRQSFRGTVPDITPFTHRDGLTYLKVLEELRAWLNNLIDTTNEHGGELSDAVTQELNSLLDVVNTELADQVESVNGQLADQDAAVIAQLDNQNTAITEQLDSQDATVTTQVTNMVTYVNDSVQAIIDSSIEVSDPVMLSVLSDPDSGSRGEVSNIVSAVSGPIAEQVARDAFTDYQLFNVRDYGATGDGISDDTAAIQAAIDAITTAGSGTLHFPPGEYNMASFARLTSNMLIEGSGATIRKRIGASSYACFAALSNGSTGYGSSVRNVVVRNLAFRGTYSGATRSLCALALHHASNVTVHDVDFTECAGSGHQVDLNGCENITIRDCVWRGFETTNGNFNSESIQIDNSNRSSVSVIDAPGSYDGLMTRNVTVQNCRFLPLTIGGTTYPAPIPIGSHGVIEGRRYENIKFVDNTIDGMVLYNGSARYPGQLHFVGVDGLEVSRNTFRNVDTVSQALLVKTAVTGKPLSAVETTNPEVSITPLESRNILISGNTFVGYDSGSVDVHIIEIEGHDSAQTAILTVEGNRVDGGSSTQPFLAINNGRNVSVRGNTVDGCSRFSRCERIRIGSWESNVANNGRSSQIHFIDAVAVTVVGNTIRSSPGAIIHFADGGAQVTVANNSGSNMTEGTNGIRIIDVNDVIVSSNILKTAGGNLSYGIHISGASVGVAVGNIVRGFDNPVYTPSPANITAASNMVS